MKVVNEEYFSDGSQGTVGGVGEGIGGLVVLWSYQLALEYVPQRLGDFSFQDSCITPIQS